jgi:nucleotide-binding universal stress UspA family protein
MTAPDPGVRHILAPTDLKQASQQAIEHALRLARRFGAKLTLFHVWDIPERVGATSGMLDFELMRKDRDRAEQAFHNLHNRIRAQHLATDCFFLAGDPCALIVSAAKSLPTDLIVISTYHRSWLSELIGRSDTERIIRNAGCPVLVVP